MVDAAYVNEKFGGVHRFRIDVTPYVTKKGWEMVDMATYDNAIYAIVRWHFNQFPTDFHRNLGQQVVPGSISLEGHC